VNSAWAIAALMIGLPAAAQAGSGDFRQRDPACQPFMAIQYLDCQLRLALHCPATDGLAGPLLREETYTAQGFHDYNIQTANGLTVEAGDIGGPFIRHDVAHSTSTAWKDLAASGGSASLPGQVSIGGQIQPMALTVHWAPGVDHVLISGVALQVLATDLTFDFPPPVGKASETLKMYYDPATDYLFEGEVTGGQMFKSDAVPHRPMSIALPGAPEFVTTKPAFCGPNLS
jgi:hypothetical protein